MKARWQALFTSYDMKKTGVLSMEECTNLLSNLSSRLRQSFFGSPWEFLHTPWGRKKANQTPLRDMQGFPLCELDGFHDCTRFRLLSELGLVKDDF